MSHDYLERLFWVDNDMIKLLNETLTPSFLENTLVIIMGIQFFFCLYILAIFVHKKKLLLKGIMGKDFIL